MKSSAKSKPKAPPSDESARKKIIAAASQLFAERGLDSVSIRDISTAAGTNIALISYYFGGKEELYRSLIREHALESTQTVGSVLTQLKGQELTKKSFSDILLQIISLIVKNRVENPDIAKIFQQERLTGLVHSREVYETIVTPLAIKLSDLIREAQKKKFVDPNIIPEVFFVTLTEAIWGYFVVSDCNLKITKTCYKLPKDTESYTKFLHSLFIKGVLI